MTTDRNDNQTAPFDWASLTARIGADMRASDAKRAERMQGMSEGFQNAAQRGNAQHATKNYGNAIGSRKYTGLW